ncbi:MAG: hypothetical protein AAB728_01270 [Patescibacteria group bacterium]
MEYDFKKICEAALSSADNASAAAMRRMEQNLQLRQKYPGEYVAFLYRTVSGTRGQFRELLAHSTDLTEVQAAIQALPQQDRENFIDLQYLEPMEDDLHVPNELPFR